MSRPTFISSLWHGMTTDVAPNSCGCVRQIDVRPLPQRRASRARCRACRTDRAPPGACSRMKATDWTARISDPRRQRMNDVVGHDLDVREPLVRGPLHQLELAHADLAIRIAGIPADRPDRRLEEHLRIPVVRFEEQQLPARLQQPVQRREVLGVGVVAEDRGADDVVEALRREARRARRGRRRACSAAAAPRPASARSRLKTAAVSGFSPRSVVARCSVHSPLPAPSSRIDSPGRTWKQCRTVSARQRSLTGDVAG